MSHARIVRRLGGTALLSLCLTCWAGCTHHHYYGMTPGSSACPPGTTAVIPNSVQYGSVCDVPSQVDGGTVVTKSGATIDTRPPKVVTSESRGSKFSWRKSDTDAAPMTTKIEGAVDDPTVTR